jgi:probable HAF family extracellular repeat protein
MRLTNLIRVTLAALLAAALVTPLTAQTAKHSRYIFRDLGTFGGPNSNVNTDSVVINKDGVVVGGADTSLFDPACGCLQSHAFKWHRDVLTDLGTLQGGVIASPLRSIFEVWLLGLQRTVTLIH